MLRAGAYLFTFILFLAVVYLAHEIGFGVQKATERLETLDQAMKRERSEIKILTIEYTALTTGSNGRGSGLDMKVKRYQEELGLRPIAGDQVVRLPWNDRLKWASDPDE